MSVTLTRIRPVQALVLNISGRVQSPLDPVFPTDPVGKTRPAAFVTPEGGQPVLDVELTLSDAEAGLSTRW